MDQQQQYIEDTKKIIDIMTRFVNGEELQARGKNEKGSWMTIKYPNWNFSINEFRIKPKLEEGYRPFQDSIEFHKSLGQLNDKENAYNSDGDKLYILSWNDNGVFFAHGYISYKALCEQGYRFSDFNRMAHKMTPDEIRIQSTIIVPQQS